MPSARDFARAVLRKVRPAPPKPEPLPRLAFIHTPKCGGTSLDAAITAAYERAGHRAIRLDARASLRAAEAAGDKLHELRSRLLLYDLASKHARYLSGHYTFTEAAFTVSRGWHFIALLRDPVARWYSAFFYNRYKESDHCARTESLAEYLSTDRAKSGQTYARQFGSGDVERAIENLSRFSVVGTLDNLAALQRDCERVLGIRLEVGHSRMNPRSTAEQQAEITPEIDAHVRALCEPDRYVYDAVRAYRMDLLPSEEG